MLKVFHVNRVIPKITGIERQLAAGYCLYAGEVAVLFDFYGLLEGLQSGPVTPATRSFLRALGSASYFETVELPIRAYEGGPA